jgi:hypothetical protein
MTRLRLTLHSRGGPTACHQARATERVRLLSVARARRPTVGLPLSSNVRRHYAGPSSPITFSYARQTNGPYATTCNHCTEVHPQPSMQLQARTMLFRCTANPTRSDSCGGTVRGFGWQATNASTAPVPGRHPIVEQKANQVVPTPREGQ